MSLNSDVTVTGASLYLLPVTTRIPLKFGKDTLTKVKCARVCLKAKDRSGKEVLGWGETPLSVNWVWPSSLTSDSREKALEKLCVLLTQAWATFHFTGDVLEVGDAFQKKILPDVLKKLNHALSPQEEIPWLAALVCCSAFDIALHECFGQLAGKPIYELYTKEYLNKDLSYYLTPAANSSVSFKGIYPSDFLVKNPSKQLPVWHLVGGIDAVLESDLTGSEPKDGHPFLFKDWIKTDGLKCVKIKLRGNDSAWDYERLIKVGEISEQNGVTTLTADFNCTVHDPQYVITILEKLKLSHPSIYDKILYIEQPFPYDLEKYPIDVKALSALKLLFLDESAHDWTCIALGRSLGWTGVALKTCKTQTGALFSACWAKAHGMALMVQDLTNPMLAMIPHVQLASHVGTILGVECNAMQFYPDASLPENEIHPGLYTRRNGIVDLSTIHGAGFGYRLSEIKRTLPPVEADYL